jgi:antitoxin component YwqK of YwqJK toxin-antitoxin module
MKIKPMKIQYFIFLILAFNSCYSTDKINQYAKDKNGVKQRNGLWVEEYSSDIGKLQGKGRYKNGEKVGLWVITFQDKVYQKERFKKYTSKVKVFNQNGELREKGQTKTLVNDNSSHWFYYGTWKYYDENGKHIYSKVYKDETHIDSIAVKK